MTNEEASFCMKQYLSNSDSLECMKCPYYHTIPIEGTENGFTCKANEAHKKAIEALEQGDVLQEIRQEIEKVFCMSVVTNELRTPMEVKTEILQIIDKYKAESEDKE